MPDRQSLAHLPDPNHPVILFCSLSWWLLGVGTASRP
jgi:hypothetical protein